MTEIILNGVKIQKVTKAKCLKIQHSHSFIEKKRHRREVKKSKGKFKVKHVVKKKKKRGPKWLKKHHDKKRKHGKKKIHADRVKAKKEINEAKSDDEKSEKSDKKHKRRRRRKKTKKANEVREMNLKRIDSNEKIFYFVHRK